MVKTKKVETKMLKTKVVKKQKCKTGNSQKIVKLVKFLKCENS